VLLEGLSYSFVREGEMDKKEKNKLEKDGQDTAEDT
jgi:hypothetical protein